VRAWPRGVSLLLHVTAQGERYMSQSDLVIAFPFKAPAAAKALTQELPELMPVDARTS